MGESVFHTADGTLRVLDASDSATHEAMTLFGAEYMRAFLICSCRGEYEYHSIAPTMSAEKDGVSLLSFVH